MVKQHKICALVIDAERDVYTALAGKAKDLHVETAYAACLQDGLRQHRDTRFSVILMRDELPDGVASQAVSSFRDDGAEAEIIIYTSGGNPEQAEEALTTGVWDYIIDPAPELILPDVLQRVVHYRRSMTVDSKSHQREIRKQLSGHGIVGSSSVLQECIDLSVRIAQSDANVLIFGESGTGKELFAAAIHNLSDRASRDMVVVDCAALTPSLAESILYGHAKGSFTGADRSRHGLIKQADGSTLFLDEIGELPFGIQKKLLRVIQERSFLPVGGTIEMSSNFRLIAATNKDLNEMTRQGTFREDLLYRLKTFYLKLPPLRDRDTDVMELAYHCRDQFCKRNKLRNKKLSPDYAMFLRQYHWPGNVRELFQTIERSITDAQESAILYPKHLPTSLRISVTQEKLRRNSSLTEGDAGQTGMRDEDLQQLPVMKEGRARAIALWERNYLQRLLVKTGGNIQKCCEFSGLSRSRLYDLLKKYQLNR